MDILNKKIILAVLLLVTASLDAKIALDITWKEKNHHIIQSSVCADYKEAPRQYRFCRIEAKSLFKKRCEDSRALLEKSKKTQRYSKSSPKAKYCYAARTFMVFGKYKVKSIDSVKD